MNVIVGENNVGKSSLLQAINLARGLPERVQLSIDYWPDGKPTGPLSLSMDFVLDQHELGPIREATPVPQKESLRNHVSFNAIWRSPGHVAESRLEFVDDDTQAVTALVRSDFSGYTTEGRIVVMGNQERGSLLRVLNDGFYYFPEFRQRPGGGEVGEEDSLRSTEGSRLAAILFRLRVGTRSQRSLFDRIQKSFTSLFSNLELQVVKVRNQPTIVISRQNSEYELPLSEVGAGIFEMVLILTHTVGEESRVFILDEPELHLHPHSQRLLEELLKASSSRNQLILATHSPHFVNFHALDGILLIREASGRSVPVKLPEDYLTDEELAKASKLVWSEDKEFLFSKRVLLVEGETEYGAIPVLAEKMGKGFDRNGVTIASVGGHHFGLFMKILKGFGFPFQVVCDSEVLMRVDARIRHGAHIVRTSTLFAALEQAGMLGEDDGRILSEYQSKTNHRVDGKDEQEFYDDEIRKPLVALANKFGFHIMTPDFEGVLVARDHKALLSEARKLFHGNKVLTGRFVAQKMESVPPEFASVISNLIPR